MTEQQDKHPKRCETCNTPCENNPDSGTAYEIGENNIWVFKQTVEWVHKFTEKHGCASHSSSGSPRVTERQEPSADAICPKHTFCRVNNGNPNAIMHFCEGIPIEKQSKMMESLEKLLFAMHCYEQEVLDADFPAPSKHRDMVEQAEALFVTLEEKERWLYRHDREIGQAAEQRGYDRGLKERLTSVDVMAEIESAREDERNKVIDAVIVILDTSTFHCYPDPHAAPGNNGQSRFLRSAEIYPKIEAFEHIASTGSMDAINAYLSECRKRVEERVKGARK